MDNVTKILSLTIVSLFSVMLSTTASAVPCSDLNTGVFDNETDLNSISSACIDGTSSNHSEADLNAGLGFFGIDTWSFLDKTDDSIDGGIGLTGGTPGTISGTFSFDSTVWDSYTDITVILKDGGTGQNNQGPQWSAYLLTQDTYAGFWVYGEGMNGNLKELSHLAVYGNPVPVPAALWLFGSGLLGLVAVSRRKVR